MQAYELPHKTSQIEADYMAFNWPATHPDEEGIVAWDEDDLTVHIHTGLGPVLQVGQEMYTLVYNRTGSDISNGSMVYPKGVYNGRPLGKP